MTLEQLRALTSDQLFDAFIKAAREVATDPTMRYRRGMVTIWWRDRHGDHQVSGQTPEEAELRFLLLVGLDDPPADFLGEGI
jgi:hypothetical protein